MLSSVQTATTMGHDRHCDLTADRSVGSPTTDWLAAAPKMPALCHFETEQLQQRAWTDGETTMATVKIGGRTTGTLSVDERAITAYFENVVAQSSSCPTMISWVMGGKSLREQK